MASMTKRSVMFCMTSTYHAEPRTNRSGRQDLLGSVLGVSGLDQVVQKDELGDGQGAVAFTVDQAQIL